MDYELAAAIRGPDDLSFDAGAWKGLVTASVRWLVAKHLGKDPDDWSQGITRAPGSGGAIPARLRAAKRFAKQEASLHVKTHVMFALDHLETDGRTRNIRRDAAKFHNWLRAEGLL